VFVASHPCRSEHPTKDAHPKQPSGAEGFFSATCLLRFTTLTPVPLPDCPPNSHGIISFADPHPLNSVVSYRYKIIGEGGAAFPRRSGVQTCGRIIVFPSYPLPFHTIAHSFARCKNSTLFFSIDCALFAQNTRGGVPPSLPFQLSTVHSRHEHGRIPPLT
jgi:hypothetical protein